MATSAYMAYGSEVSRSEYVPERSIVGQPETSPIGNLILRVGHEHPAEGSGWHQTEHVVMQPDEARAFIAACSAALDEHEAR